MRAGRFEYLAQDSVLFGQRLAAALGSHIEERGHKSVYVIASRTLSRQSEHISALRSALGERFAGLHDETEAQTPRCSVLALAEKIRAARADVLIAVGGGTVIDAGKMALLCLAEDIRTPDELGRYRVTVDDDGVRHVPVVRRSPLRQIVAPTTLSGAEFSRASGCLDPHRATKDLYIFEDMCSSTVVLDPWLALDTPLHLWLSTGIKALDHAVEALCSRSAQPFTDALAIQAIELLARALPAAHADPSDPAPRQDAQFAVWLASFGASQVEAGASHGIGHQLGAVAGVLHGYTSCITLPTVLRFNAPVTAEKQRRISAALGVPHVPAHEAVAALIAGLKMPTKLREVGVERHQWDAIARGAAENHMVRSNPRALRHPEEIMALLEMME